MVDHWVGRFLAKLDQVGRREDTVVLLLSDHGKILGEFDAFGMNEKQTCRALYAVPCMIRHPRGEGAGARVDAPAYNIDAMATVINLMGEAPPPQNEGVDLWPIATEGAPPYQDHIVCAYNTTESVWQEDWLYIHDAEAETEALYDLAADPEQKQNLADTRTDVRKELAEKLAAAKNRGS